MSSFNNTSVDPRERLMIVGNQILDLVYELEEGKDLIDAIRAAKPGSAESAALMQDFTNVEAVITSLTRMAKRDTLTREYIILRQTIEALGGNRPEVSL